MFHHYKNRNSRKSLHSSKDFFINILSQFYLTSFNFIVLAWGISSVIKFAQGSGTVAMITSAGIMLALMESITLPFHPIYIYLAIGFGSMTLSWMNDSGFWVVSKLSGFTEVQMLNTWTVTLASMSVLGLIQTLILSIIIPLN